MECWWAQPSSHDGSVHVHSRARSVSGTIDSIDKAEHR